MQPSYPDAGPDDSLDAFDESSVFDFVPFRVMDACSSDLIQLEEMVDDAVHQVRRLRDALLCGEPLAKAAAVMSAERFLAQFAAPVPLE